MDGATVIFPDAYIKEDGSENTLGIDYNGFIIEIVVGNELIRLNRIELAGLLAMMNEVNKD